MLWNVKNELVLHSAMNTSSISLLVVLVAVGYVAHPMVLPFVEDKLPKSLQVQADVSEPIEVAGLQPVVAEEPKSQIVIEEIEVVEVSVVEEVVEMVEVEELIPAAVEWDALELLKKVVSEGDVESISYEDVQSWELGEDEEIGGEIYVVGHLVITPTTIFGRKPQKVKALMQDGKVIKWVQVSTEKELN